MYREELDGYRMLLVAGIIVIVLTILGGFMYYATQPTMRDMETEGIRHSQQYVTTKQTLLLDLLRDYDELETAILTSSSPTVVSAKRAQQKAIYARIQTEAATLDRQYVPIEIQQFLAKKGN